MRQTVKDFQEYGCQYNDQVLCFFRNNHRGLGSMSGQSMWNLLLKTGTVTQTDFFLVLHFTSVTVIPPVLHTNLYRRVTKDKWAKRGEPSKKQCSFVNRTAFDRKASSLSL